MLYGMGKSDIYQIVFDQDSKVRVYESEENILDETIEIPKEVSIFAIGLDMTFLTKIEDSEMLKVADVNPKVIIEYLDGDELITESHDLIRLPNYTFKTKNKTVTLTSIKCEGIPDDIKTFIHSLLIAF